MVRRLFFVVSALLAVSACSSAPGDEIGSSAAAWTSGTPACGTNIGSWSGTNAYSNGKCFGNVNCTNCDGQGFTVHTSSNNATAYGGAWQCVELVTRAFDTKYKIWLSNNAGTPLCNSANGTAGLTVYGPGYHNTSPPKPIGGDAVVWNYNGGIGHVALVTGGGASSVTYLQQNWGSTTGYAATGTTPWSGSNFGAPSDSLGGFTPACWIHVNANAVGTCPYGNGLYCGGNGVAGDPDTLYTCTNGVVTADTVCGVSCQHMPNYVNDQCAACPKGDGTYCGGGGVGTDPSTVYQCTGGQVTPVTTCSSGCQTAAVGTSASCIEVPGSSALPVQAPPPDSVITMQRPDAPAPPVGGCNASPGANAEPPGTLAMLAGLFALVFRRRRRPTRSVGLEVS